MRAKHTDDTAIPTVQEMRPLMLALTGKKGGGQNYRIGWNDFLYGIHADHYAKKWIWDRIKSGRFANWPSDEEARKAVKWLRKWQQGLFEKRYTKDPKTGKVRYLVFEREAPPEDWVPPKPVTMHRIVFSPGGRPKLVVGAQPDPRKRDITSFFGKMFNLRG